MSSQRRRTGRNVVLEQEDKYIYIYMWEVRGTRTPPPVGGFRVGCTQVRDTRNPPQVRDNAKPRCGVPGTPPPRFGVPREPICNYMLKPSVSH